MWLKVIIVEYVNRQILLKAIKKHLISQSVNYYRLLAPIFENDNNVIGKSSVNDTNEENNNCYGVENTVYKGRRDTEASYKMEN